MKYVLAPQEMEWHKLEKPEFPGIGFQFTGNVVDKDYTSAYSIQLSRMGPGGRSKLHREPFNHAFYIVAGTGTVRVEKETFDLEPGTLVKIPQGIPHALDNTGSTDLEFLVIYDPPYVTGTNAVPNLED